MRTWKKTMAATLLIASTTTAAMVWAGTLQPPMATPVMDRVSPIAAPAPDTLLPQTLKAVPAYRAVPTVMTMSGKAIAFDQLPMLSAGSLMVPLRAVAEAAGGHVDWNGDGQTVAVKLPGFTANINIGSEAAKVITNNNVTLTINMARAPQLVGGRTLISADALSSVMGIMESTAEGTRMELLPVLKPAGPVVIQPGEVLPVKDIFIGQIEEVKAGEQTRFLLKGSPMTSGEPTLVWFTVSEATKMVSIDEKGQDRAISASDLKAGQTVEVELAGPMLLSYPAQAGAAVVKVLPTVSDTAPVKDIVTGTISEVEPGYGERIRILLKGALMSNGEPNLIWLTINKETKVIKSENGQEQSAFAADLKTGQTVEVELAGPIMESYPAQAAAAVVKIVPAAGETTPAKDLLTGQIQEMKSGEQTRFLLNGANFIWIYIEKETKIISSESGTDMPAMAADLKVGQSVEVELVGPIMKSYPAQGAAAVVRILPAL